MSISAVPKSFSDRIKTCLTTVRQKKVTPSMPAYLQLGKRCNGVHKIAHNRLKLIMSQAIRTIHAIKHDNEHSVTYTPKTDKQMNEYISVKKLVCCLIFTQKH